MSSVIPKNIYNVIGETINISSTNGSLTFLSNGYVGIGTTLPAFTLDINGNTRIVNGLTTSSLFTTSLTTSSLFTTNINTTNISSSTLYISNNSALASNSITGDARLNIQDSSTRAISFYSSTTKVGGISYSSTSAPIRINAGSNDNQLCLTSNGNVGIGTTTATYTLDINGSLEATGTSLLLNNSNTIGSILTTGGNVGIGKVPTQTLDVNGKIASTQTSLVGFTNIVQRFPIMGVGEYAAAQSFSTTSGSTYTATIIPTNIYAPIGGGYEQTPATGATRIYRLFAIYSDDVQTGTSFQIRFNFASGSPTSQSFSFPSTWGVTSDRRMGVSETQASINVNHANSVSLVIPNGVTGKGNGGTNMSSVNVKLSYIELQYIDQY